MWLILIQFRESIKITKRLIYGNSLASFYETWAFSVWIRFKFQDFRPHYCFFLSFLSSWIVIINSLLCSGDNQSSQQQEHSIQKSPLAVSLISSLPRYFIPHETHQSVSLLNNFQTNTKITNLFILKFSIFVLIYQRFSLPN